MSTSSPAHAPEVRLAIAGAAGAGVLGVVVVVGAVLLGHADAALALALGPALVVLTGLVVIPLLRLGGAAGNEMVVAMSLAALGLRVMVSLIAFAVLRTTDVVDMRTFAIGLAVALVGALAAEMTAASRDPRFFWVQVPPAQGRPAPPARPAAPRGDTERQLT